MSLYCTWWSSLTVLWGCWGTWTLWLSLTFCTYIYPFSPFLKVNPEVFTVGISRTCFFAPTSPFLHAVIINASSLDSRKSPVGCGLVIDMKLRPATNKRGDLWGSTQWQRSSVKPRPMRGEFCDVLPNQSGPNAGGLGLVGWHRRTSGSGLRYVFSIGWSLHPVASLRGEGGGSFL